MIKNQPHPQICASLSDLRGGQTVSHNFLNSLKREPQSDHINVDLRIYIYLRSWNIMRLQWVPHWRIGIRKRRYFWFNKLPLQKQDLIAKFNLQTSNLAEILGLLQINYCNCYIYFALSTIQFFSKPELTVEMLI